MLVPPVYSCINYRLGPGLWIWGRRIVLIGGSSESLFLCLSFLKVIFWNVIKTSLELATIIWIAEWLIENEIFHEVNSPRYLLKFAWQEEKWGKWLFDIRRHICFEFLFFLDIFWSYIRWTAYAIQRWVNSLSKLLLIEDITRCGRGYLSTSCWFDNFLLNLLLWIICAIVW